ncbi:hypothetical protein NE865_09469 [Phthorimaea operculella]|nr:hypothetical protein NE865_09469 [Phthorimaea operculella]
MTEHNVTDLFHKLQDHPESLDKVYDCMKQDDLAVLAMTALEVLKETKVMPKFSAKWKSDTVSVAFREEGNKAYVAGRYQIALMHYNQALLFAPNYSKALLLAYSNRSALFHKTKNFGASVKDIETCLKLKCDNELLQKLSKRKLDCQQNLWRDKCRFGLFRDNYFRISKQHQQIPCASDDVKIVVDPETLLPRVTAAKDIKVGTVVAVEKAFTHVINPMNYYLCCYYCQKMSLNLIPCTTCTYALFCDKECKDRCTKESHSVECHILEFLQGGFCGPYSRLTFRTVIKIKLMCSTWKEFTEASYNMGNERIRTSSIDQIYDGNDKFSMLNFVEWREVKGGAKYNVAFMVAVFLEHLMNAPFFFPIKAAQKDEAVLAVARMSMHLFLKFFNKIELNNVADDRFCQMLKSIVPNYGYFAFASKLRQDCFGNVMPFALNDRVALVAVQPIRKGAELTQSYVEHAFDALHDPRHTVKERVIEMYRFARCCFCVACSGKKPSTTLNDKQKKLYRKWLTQASDVVAAGTDSGYKPTCEMLSNLQGLAHTPEHFLVYGKFRALLAVYQYIASNNHGPYEN